MTHIFILFYSLVTFLYSKVLGRFARTKSTYTNNTQMRGISLVVEPFKCFYMRKIELIFQRCFAIGKLRYHIAIPPILSFEQDECWLIVWFGEDLSSEVH